MQLTYLVHSITDTTLDVTVDVGGVEVAAKIPGLVVELIDPETEQSITLRLPPPHHDAATRELFTAGAEIGVTFAAL